jgi:IrrE N-terminal-like domain
MLPLLNLERDFGVDGYLTLDPTTIIIDQQQMISQETRYRFTLGHEIGHLLLHRDFYEEANIKDLPSYLAAYEALDERLLDQLEFQARNLAGRVLLPRDQFTEAARVALDWVRGQLPHGTKVSTKGICSVIAGRIAPQFNVHDKVAETRLVGDGICELIGLKKNV